MTGTVHIFDYLQTPEQFPAAPVCAVFGDEPFLRTLALQQLRTAVLGEHDDAPFTTFDGTTVEWRDVIDEVATISLFGGDCKRLAIIDDADTFVTRHRSRLEDYVQRPHSRGVLVLMVGTWASNTRLYQALDRAGLQIDCRLPQKTAGKKSVVDESRITQWLMARARQSHHVRLQPPAAQLLLELVGFEFGVLNQDLAKLALFAGSNGEITAEMVRDIVGGWRTKTIWELLDFVCDGNSAAGLRELDRLLQAGENPLALYGQIAWSLRRFAAAARIFERAERSGRRVPLANALEQAGFRRWPQGAMENAERQLKQIGRDRAGRLYRWLLETDLAMKGTHSSPDRARRVLELLFVRLDKLLAPRASSESPRSAAATTRR